LENGHENRPRDKVDQREFLFPDEMVNTYFLKTMFSNSLRGFRYMDLRFAPIRLLNSLPAAGRRLNYCIALINIFARTGFTLIIIPHALPCLSR
jgi:hypothetical protein